MYAKSCIRFQAHRYICLPDMYLYYLTTMFPKLIKMLRIVVNEKENSVLLKIISISFVINYFENVMNLIFILLHNYFLII